MRVPLVVLEVFVGLGAVAGGVGVATNSIGLPEYLLRGSPFGSYLVSGLVLTFVVSGSQLVAAAAVLRRHGLGALAAALAGLVLVGWMVVQVANIALHNHPVMDCGLPSLVAPANNLARTRPGS